ncbi:MAG: AraC family transcriptional regulator of arabinose operon [Kiritimatiellia bacterium]|jgi:AraC family transcriptional regulator, arabinose operon regulatory protein
MLISSSIAVHAEGTIIRREPHFKHWTCAYLYKGEIALDTDDQHLVISTPSFILIPPHLPYEFIVTVPDEHIWAIFDSSPRLDHVLDAGSRKVKSSDLNLDALIDTALAEAMKESLRWWRSEPMRSMLSENALERALLLSGELEDAEGNGLDSRLAAALSYITKNLTEAISVPDLAAEACLSPSRFAALFKTETGTSPARYIESKRMETACDRLLSSNASIAQIAESVGYCNAFHFSARFRAVYDQSPRDFRRSPLRRRHEIRPQTTRHRDHLQQRSMDLRGHDTE